LLRIDHQAMVLQEHETVRKRAASWPHDQAAEVAVASETPAVACTSSAVATSGNHYHPHAVSGETVTFLECPYGS
jgi:hypothetical protein